MTELLRGRTDGRPEDERNCQETEGVAMKCQICLKTLKEDLKLYFRGKILCDSCYLIKQPNMKQWLQKAKEAPFNKDTE